MPDEFRVLLQTLAELLSGARRYRVPSFQRPYSWTTKEALQLLEDLLHWIAQATDRAHDIETRRYFLGTILLVREPADAGEPEADIVDGQQRIVTLSILIALLRDMLAATEPALAQRLDAMLALPTAAQGSAPRRHRLALRGESADHLTSLALRPGATEQEAPEGEPPPGVSNMIAVREALGDALDELEDQELVALGDLIGSVCCIAVIETSHVDDAHRIFMVLNDRGKPLDRKDILKAEVLGRVALDQRQRCLVIWEERERLLGVGFEVLFGHIRAIHGRSGPRIIDGIRSIIAETGGAERFVDRVFAPAADALAAINHCRHEGSPHSAAICRRLRYLGWLTGTEWVPATLAFWLANPDKPEVLYAFLREIDRIAYTARLLGLGGDKRIARFDRLTDLVRSGRGLDTRLAPHVLTREELRNINYNLRSLHYRSQQTCKLVLMRLSDEIAGREENLDPADYTVEHVLPLNPGRTSSWRTVIPDAEERARVANLLGNLVLVPRALNADAGNLDLSAKLDLYFAAGRPRQPAITEQLRGLATWNADTIRARDADFASRLQRMWRLEDAPSEPATPPASGRPRRRGRARTSD